MRLCASGSLPDPIFRGHVVCHSAFTPVISLLVCPGHRGLYVSNSLQPLFNALQPAFSWMHVVSQITRNYTIVQVLLIIAKATWEMAVARTYPFNLCTNWRKWQAYVSWHASRETWASSADVQQHLGAKPSPLHKITDKPCSLTTHHVPYS